jgi:hypothetical protein
MTKFDMGAAWEDSMVLLRSHRGLIGAIAAVFLFLPALAFAWFGPVPVEPPTGATFEQIVSSMRENISQMLVGRIIAGLFAMVGGEALRFAAIMIPTIIGVQIASGILIFGGVLLFILPGLYLAGRLALVSPVIADRGLHDPLAAIRISWDMTRNNGWAIFFFVFLVALVIGIASLIAGGIVGAVFGTAEGVGRMVTGFVEAGFAALTGLVTLAITAAAYRQLSVSPASDTFG